MSILTSLLRPLRHPIPQSAIPMDRRSLREVRKWRRKGNVYCGYYTTEFGSWYGNISLRGDVYGIFIKKPPVAELRRHHKWICFHERQRGWFEINLWTNPSDGGDIEAEVSAAIGYVERLIVESFRRSRTN